MLAITVVASVSQIGRNTNLFSSVRNQAVESIYVILSKICIGARKSGALSTAIALLFDNIDKTESRAEIAGSYFHLLCRYIFVFIRIYRRLL